MEHMNFTWSESGGDMKMGSIFCCSSFHNSFVWGSAQIGNAVEKLSGHLF